MRRLYALLLLILLAGSTFSSVSQEDVYVKEINNAQRRYDLIFIPLIPIPIKNISYSVVK